jgi:putative ABC transport system permease protein
MLLRDIKDGLRSLVRAPGFAFLVVLTLGLGMGAAVTMFSVMHAVLWRPLPYPDADRLVLLDGRTPARERVGLTSLEQLDVRRQSRTLDSVAAISGVNANLDIDGELERVYAVSASDEALRMLGGQLALGRPASDRHDIAPAGSISAVAISDSLWRRRFGADPAVVGRFIQVNNLRAQVVGVLRPGLELFLPAEWNAAEDVELWFPRGTSIDMAGRESVLARLAPGVPLARAQAELDAMSAAFAAARPETPVGWRMIATPLVDRLTAGVQPALVALAVAVGFVLLISCVNVTNLLLARSKAREREISVRQALGAGRGRLIGLLLTESAMLVACGSAVGLMIATIGVDLIEWLGATELPRQSQIQVDVTTALFAAGVSVVACLGVGLLPAVRGTGHHHDVDVLRAGRLGASAPGVRRLQRGLVVAEVALSIVPLVGGGLMLRSFWNLANAPLGFNPAGVVSAQAQMSFQMYPTPERRWAFVESAIDAVRQIPGVEKVSASSAMPYVQPTTRRFAREGDASSELLATMQSIAPGYLDVIRARLLQGRDITADDISRNRPLAIVDERLARRLWPEGAVGKRLDMVAGPRRVTLDVVGIVAPVRAASVREGDTPHVFLSYNLFATDPWLAIRTTQSAAALAPSIRRAVEGLGGRRPVVDIRPLQAYVDKSYGNTRFTMLLLTSFAAASLLLVGIGMYATMAYLISQRMGEFGVRAAFGASPRSLVTLVMRETAGLTAAGGVAGFVVTLSVTGALRGLLYGVSPVDTATILAVATVTIAAAIVAATIPARRASRADAAAALRG